jgi:hypothetical protein
LDDLSKSSHHHGLFGWALAVWLVLIAVEFIHGTLRTIFLVPVVGDFRSRQIGVFTGSVLILAVAYVLVPWLHATGRRALGCVEVEAAYYGAPPGWIGRRVQVQWDARSVLLLDPRTGQLLREHWRHARGGHRIKDEVRTESPARLFGQTAWTTCPTMRSAWKGTITS